MEDFKQEVFELIALQLTDRQVHAFKIYETELLEWNERINLTAITDSRGVYTKHFLDSLSPLIAMRKNKPRTLIDIGTGAGFPGIPLKIAIPGLKVTLVDSIGKKIQFCEQLIAKLGLKDIEVVLGRAEDVARIQKFREGYDCAIARAVAGLPALVEYLIPFVRVGGIAIAQKGDAGPAEANRAANAIHLLGGRLQQVHRINLPRVVEDRYLISIDKVSATPGKYPRRTGVPIKNPIS
jgi:16S rRNA (guanine527-N7)-methyltransferase